MDEGESNGPPTKGKHVGLLIFLVLCTQRYTKGEKQREICKRRMGLIWLSG